MEVKFDELFDDSSSGVMGIVWDYKKEYAVKNIEHWHRFEELVVVLNGTGCHCTEGKSYQIFAGDVFLIHSGKKHSYLNIDNLVIGNLLFDPKLYKNDFELLKENDGYSSFFLADPKLPAEQRFKSRFTLEADKLNRISQFLKQLQSLQNERSKGWKFQSKIIFMQIIWMICEFLAEEKKDTKSIHRMGKVLSYLENNLSEEVTLEKLSRIAHRSVSSLLRDFKTTVGESPIQYLQTMRLNKAAEMLRETNLSLSVIAFSVGFDDSNYFSKMFRKRYAVSPRDYRKASQH